MEMTENRINELAKECSKKLNDLSDGIQDDEIIVLGYFRTVVAEVWNGAIDETGDVAIHLAYEVMGATLGLARSYSDRLGKAIEQLKK